MNRLVCVTACFLIFSFLPNRSEAGRKRRKTEVVSQRDEASETTRGIQVVKDARGEQVCLYKESHALLIGVSDYTAGWMDLNSVPQEMDDIADALKRQGFTVTRVMNPDHRELKNAFESFINDYGYDSDSRLLFFFSGHGYSRNGGTKGYLVPTDAPNPERDNKGFLRKALPMTQILSWCRQMEAKHTLFMFDSCFSGTVFKSKSLPKLPPPISANLSKPVRQFISAGDAGQEVPAKSVFAKCFLKGLSGEADLTKDGYITGMELGMYLRDRVIYYRTGQTPLYGKIRDPELDEGDFVFVTGTAGVTSDLHPLHTAKSDRRIKTTEALENNSSRNATKSSASRLNNTAEFSHTRHILLKVSSDADRKTKLLKKRELEGYRKLIVDGKADFSEIAMEYSDCPSGKRAGGDLGFFKRGVMVPEFEKAAFGQQVGVVGPVIETPFGYHIVEVMERKPVSKKQQ